MWDWGGAYGIDIDTGSTQNNIVLHSMPLIQTGENIEAQPPTEQLNFDISCLPHPLHICMSVGVALAAGFLWIQLTLS